MKFHYILLFTALLGASSCDNDEPETESSNKPTTYNFSNVDYSGQTARLDMLAELTTEMKKPGSGFPSDAQVMLNMFANENQPFTDNDLNTSTKQLKNKCFSGVISSVPNDMYFENYLNKLAGLSTTHASDQWEPGTAGVSTSGSKSYFFDENGVEYAQLVEKGLMGAVFYYQICETYTREGKIGDAVDNETIEEGKGTDMEHHWDEAFGYFGATTDLTEGNYSEKDLRYHAKYAKKGSEAGLGTVGLVMNKFIDGRFAISSKNYVDRDVAAQELRTEYELIMATTAMHYINGAIADFGDDALRNHQLSEAYAFIVSLHYNSDKLISDAQLNDVKAMFEETLNGVQEPNFLNLTVSKLNEVKIELSNIYGLDSVKDTI